MAISITTPMDFNIIKSLKVGDQVLLSGIIYTARDAAHIRLCNAIKNKIELPIPIKDQIIYYAGPTPTPPNKAVGAIGPTTSMRMDSFTPLLHSLGLCATIGKGNRSEAVIESIKNNNAVYFAALGGCAATGANCVLSSEVVAYDDLGTESIKKIVVKNLPLVVAVDSYGNDLYKSGPMEYLQNK